MAILFGLGFAVGFFFSLIILSTMEAMTTPEKFAEKNAKLEQLRELNEKMVEMRAKLKMTLLCDKCHKPAIILTP